MNTSYHTHTKRCKHARGSAIDYAKYAFENNFTILGFAEHIPFSDGRMDFCRMNYEELNEYLEEIDNLKSIYPNIKIYKGFEVEYFEEQKTYYKEILTKVDYLILGQHAIKKDNEYIFIENCRSKEDFYMYVEALDKGAKTGYFSLINHPDLFGLAIEEWNDLCIDLTHKIANIAVKYNIPLELNAQGIRRWTKIKSRDFAYPIIEFWEIIAKEYPQIPIIISSDAHSPEALNDYAVSKCEQIAKDLSLNISSNLNFKEQNK